MIRKLSLPHILSCEDRYGPSSVRVSARGLPPLPGAAVAVLATWIIRSKTLTFSVVCFLSPPILLFSKVVVSWYVSHVSIERTT